MQRELNELRKQVADLTAQVQTLREDNSALRIENAALKAENKTLQQQNAFLRKQLFGKKSEKLDRKQLELLLGVDEAPFVIESVDERGDDDLPPGPRRGRQGGERKVGIPEGTPTEEVVIDPEEVTRNPEAYECIGEEVTRELDVVPHPYILRLIKRRKFKSKTDRSRPPLLAPAPPRLIEGSCASPGLLTDILLKKYVDHLPLFRQSQILKTRYGIELSHKTLCDWAGIVAGWFKPIYNLMGKELQQSDYLQVDESPVRYLFAKGGGSGMGYLWVFHHPATAGRPGGDVLYEWHTGRGADCLERMLDDFRGPVQCDGYIAYTAYAKGRDDIDLVGCWAHTRRNFFEALEEVPGLARWMLHQIGQLYRIEAELRETGAGPKLRQAVRLSQSAMILARIEKVLRLKLPQHLPKSLMGGAIAYALGQWKRLLKFRDDGRLEIDNNLVENAIRPTALGKKNWLFFGAPNAGERSAIIYTILESCKRRGIDQVEYLRDVLTRLPTMKITEVAQLTPANWAAAREKAAA
ncbi:MAG: IS66 family transposase [bacterium]